MKKLITYTDHRMTISADKLAASALKYGFDQVRIYTPADLPDDFKEKMFDVLACERGAGFYCWKPWVVNDALKDMTSSDVLMWSDAGTEMIQPVSLLIDECLGSPDNLFFSNGWNHVDWCKMDLLRRFWPSYGMAGSLEVEHMTALVSAAKQVQASQFLMRGTTRMKRFTEEWLEVTLEPGMINNNPSILPNVLTFSEHRWDQSILCCLQIFYGFKLHWFPSTYGYHIKDVHPDDKYPAMFLHHRKRNNEW